MKRITAIAIAAAAVLGCSYVGESSAVSCAVGIKNINIQRDLGVYDRLPDNAQMDKVMKDACKLGERYRKGNVSEPMFDVTRSAVMKAIANNKADDEAKAQVIAVVSDLMDVGYYGEVKAR